MEKNDVVSSKNDYSKYIEALSQEAAIKILLELCNDGVIAERISAFRRRMLGCGRNHG